MATKSKLRQNFIRFYKQKTGETEVNMRDVAAMAEKMGWAMPKPTSPIDLLAQQFSQAAREEIRRDDKTGRPYRANHAYTVRHGFGEQMTFWVDIDEANRKQMTKCLVQRREQMVGDAVQLTLDADHWNTVHATEEPIVMAMDFAEDVQWRLNAPEEDGKAA
jgi:hypothetical protein